MIFAKGKNYLYFFATSNSVARLQAEKSPFYDYKTSLIPELPSLSSEPVLVPRFLYSLQWNREVYPSQGTILPPYPFASSKTSDWNPIEKATYAKPAQIHLDQTKRDQYGSAYYLSLRDFVNPELGEKEVIEKIESLYFDSRNKNYLFRLVKILYSGTPSEEYKIVSNLFTFELEFAEFLRTSIFSIEILPLIHGPFLNSFLNSFDDRYIRFIWNKLSKPVQGVIQKSISKNRFKMMLDSPSVEPKPGEGLIEQIEKEIYKRFSRKIYYEEGSFFAYRFPGSNRSDLDESKVLSVETKVFFAELAEKFEFSVSEPYLEFLFLSQNRFFFQTKDWIDLIRFDWILSKKDWESLEFHRLPPDLILEIPAYPTGQYLLGAGITKERKGFEFALQWF